MSRFAQGFAVGFIIVASLFLPVSADAHGKCKHHCPPKTTTTAAPTTTKPRVTTTTLPSMTVHVTEPTSTTAKPGAPPTTVQLTPVVPPVAATPQFTG